VVTGQVEDQESAVEFEALGNDIRSIVTDVVVGEIQDLQISAYSIKRNFQPLC
jgi:hypothetical protein